jgi:DNA replication protein DnaC
MKTQETAQCWQCQNHFQWVKPDSRAREPRFCAQCEANEIEARYQSAAAKTEAEVEELTPARYRATNIAHTDFNRKLWQRIQTWRPTEERPWLGLIGPTGTSKTRCAFLLLRDISQSMIQRPQDPDGMAWRPSIAVASAYSFAETVMAQFSAAESKHAAARQLQQLRRARVLLIDDLGKQRNTPAVAGELFALLDHRHAENLCTLWTANTTPEGIVAGLAEEMAAPLAGRIRECSNIINIS